MSNTIKSIAIFDIETSGLPTYDGFRTKITEISFVACSVEHLNGLKSSETVPRVLHKLSLCLNPRKRIEHEASKATGLDNYMLEHEKQFTEKTGNMIKTFLEHLQQPVCLIAHNGDGFDFPILAKELQNQNVTFPDTVYCIDSLHAFREIDSINESKNDDKNANESDTIQLQPLPNDLLDNSDDDDGVTKLDSSDDEDESVDFQKLNESTPHRLPSNVTPKRKYVANGNDEIASKKLCQTRLSFVGTPKRKLFSVSVVSPSTKQVHNPNQFKPGYKLNQLYTRFLKKMPDVTHHAEADVMLLLQCIAATKKDFIPFMYGDALLFSDVKPIGTINDEQKGNK